MKMERMRLFISIFRIGGRADEHLTGQIESPHGDAREALQGRAAYPRHIVQTDAEVAAEKKKKT